MSPTAASATRVDATSETPPRLRLLGPPAMQHADGRSTPWTAERGFLLLALLACRRDWVGRDELADRLYPNRELAAARSNLRKVLHLARQVEGADDIEQRGDLLRWSPDSDLARFEAACSAQRHAEAIALYGGPLLQGLDAGFPAEAADWLHAERQRLHARWHEACTRRLAALQAEPTAAADLAQTLLRADPLDETALHALARAQQSLGRPGEALAALQAYERQLSDAVGLPPSAALRALGDALQGPAGPLPPAGTTTGAEAPLVGRRQELAQIAQRLAEPGCRLLTLLGEPGVGKSTLARAVLARHAGRGVWVALEDLLDVEQLPERIARLAGLALDRHEPPWPALAQAVGDAPMLLVLDNAEHLSLAAALDGLFDARPTLRALATSRSPVGSRGEWRLPITGLPLPDADETDAEVLRANDAVRLFEQRARPLAPAFDLAAEAADVVRLVHEVDGLPLAIELLAAWRRLMPVHEILAELAESLEVLEPDPPSERSVRASFARAWQQLGAIEQRVLAQMAVLPGPLTRAQVRAVLQAPLPVLAALADRSLVRAEGSGVFALHPLIRRCAAPLAQDLPALRQRHARQLAQRLAAADDAAGIDLAHLAAAWQWAVEQADAAVLKALARPLRERLQHRAGQERAAALLAAARGALLQRLPADAAPGADGRDVAQALCTVLGQHSALAYVQGELGSAEALAAESEAWAGRLGDVDAQVAAIARRATVRWQRGHYEEALSLNDRAVALERAAGQAEPGRDVLAQRALLLKALGRYDEARAIYEGLLAGLRRRGALRHSLSVPNNLANLLRLLGRGREALALLHEALQLARTPGDPTDQPFLLTNLALVHEALREPETAARWAGEALRSAREFGEPMIEAAALLAQARLGAALRRPSTEGLEAVASALRIGHRLSSEPLVLQCLSSAGVVLARGGQRQLGVALVRWAQRQARFARSEREDAERHLAPLRIDASEEAAALRLLPPETPLAQVLAAVPAPA